MEKRLTNAKNIEKFGAWSEQACWGGEDDQYWLDKAWEERGRAKASVLWMGELQVNKMFDT